MPGLIVNATNVTLADINQIANSTSLVDFNIKVSHFVYNDLLWYLILWLIGLILWIIAQKKEGEEPIKNALIASTAVTVLAFIGRGIQTPIDGITYYLINNHQLFSFLIITALLAMITWATKRT